MAVATQQSQNISQASLYVGDLHPMVTEAMLHAKFLEIGQVLNTRVCRDLATRASLGYAYVNFEDPKDAERALENMNYELLNNRPMRIMWSQRDPSLRKSGKGNIFIKNLDKSIQQKELYDTFSFFGRVLSCKIAMDEHGNSKGYGFVHFEKEECAQKAIEKINGMLIRDRLVYVDKFIPCSERKSHAGKVRFNNLYAKNFPPETTTESLKEMFTEFGEISSCCVEKDAEGKSKGFGFVCFVDPDHAEAAVAAMHGKEIGGKMLYCSRAQRKEERQEELKQKLERQRAERQQKYIPGVNLYVKNLDDNVDDEHLKEAFSRYGSITSAKVMTDSNGRSKGFGFVCFTQPEQAARAVTEMNASIVGSKPLYVALAQRKEDRRAKLIADHQERLRFRTMNQPLPPAAAHLAAPNYFAPAFPPAQRFYHPNNAVIGSQPRWNRPTGMTGSMPTQLGSGIPQRASVPFVGAPNSAAGLAANMAALAQMRSPAAAGRPMVPAGMPTLPAGPHMQASALMNPGAGQQRHQAVGRPTTMAMQQVIAQSAAAMPQRHTMASVVAGGANPNVRLQRPIMQHTMPNMSNAAPNVRFNQTARNVSAPVPGAIPSVLAPLGDQNPLTMSALSLLSQDEQKRTLGERLFPLVQEIYPSLAQKLTGMLLLVNNAELIHLLESKESLKEKLEEAIGVLKSNTSAAPEIPEEAAHTTQGDANVIGQNGDGALETRADLKSQSVLSNGIKTESS